MNLSQANICFSQHWFHPKIAKLSSNWLAYLSRAELALLLLLTTTQPPNHRESIQTPLAILSGGCNLADNLLSNLHEDSWDKKNDSYPPVKKQQHMLQWLFYMCVQVACVSHTWSFNQLIQSICTQNKLSVHVVPYKYCLCLISVCYLHSTLFLEN